MEKLEKYRQLIKQILLKYHEHSPSEDGVDAEVILDTERDHYQFMYVGWDQQKWVHGCVIHIDIKNGKIWIQWNGTELDIAEELVAAGVPKEDIVLGFQSPFMRQFTEYAVN